MQNKLNQVRETNRAYAIILYKKLRKTGSSHKEAITRLKALREPWSHIRAGEHGTKEEKARYSQFLDKKYGK